MRVESGPYEGKPGQDVLITINVGDSIVFENGVNGSNGNTQTHFLTIDELGIDLEFAPGESTDPGYTIAPTEPGTYRIYCSAHPDDHGKVTLVVNAVSVGGGPAPVVYTLDKIRIRDGLFDVRMGDTTAWGYDAGSRNESGPYEGNPGADVFLVINLGDSIVFEDGIDGSNGNAETHFFTVDELGIDIELAPGTSTDPGFTLAPTEAGTYKLYCSAHPDDHGLVFLVVVDQAAAPASPATYTLDMIRIRDGLFDVRMGETAYWGYDAGMRVESGPYEGKSGQDVFMTINVGDSIVFETSVNGSNGNVDTHFLTIDGLGIDLEFPPGTATDPGYTLAPTEAGTYRIYCSAHPDDHGNVFLIVQ
ncbi:MAG: hypothetical protein IIC31_07040 [Chloroflexi bacterium]|nr:hypothetical protein [Chloroflexota bacterium]